MGLLDKVLRELDMPAIAGEIMKGLQIKEPYLYFAVANYPDEDGYDVLGMAYSKKAAEDLLPDTSFINHQILELDLSKVLKVAVGLEFAKVVYDAG